MLKLFVFQSFYRIISESILDDYVSAASLQAPRAPAPAPCEGGRYSGGVPPPPPPPTGRPPACLGLGTAASPDPRPWGAPPRRTPA